MSRKLTVQLFGLIACAVLIGAGVALAQSTVPAPVLPRIEKYKAPRYPPSGGIDRETYDYRLLYNKPRPPTLTDVLVCDVWQRVTMDLKLKITPKEVTEEAIKQALNVYLTRRWEDIAGYRPWTHWNLVRSLKPPQRERLAKEIVEYIGKTGVRDVED